MPIIIETDNAVSVDWNTYDLSLDEAAKELYEGRNVVAREYTDYGDDFHFPDVDVLNATYYKGMTEEKIVDAIRGYYESFGRSKV